MKLKYLCFSIFVLILFIRIIASEDTLVRVEQGWLQGRVVELVTKDGTYFSFKGIPYAAPPVGELRFKAPQPPRPWDGVRNASEHGARCPHQELFTGINILEGEDCLFLNVYTRNLTPEKLFPVIMNIHGGGYRAGSGNTDSFGPDFLVPHDVVLVTINFRLEALGFLSLDNEDVPGNAGLKDQVAALRWIQKNIASFGGDPDNVTVMGQSAGAGTVALHATSPMSKGLFKRGIALSGSPNSDWSQSFEARRRAFNLAKDLGFYTTNTTELLQFLQSVPYEDLVFVTPAVVGVETISNYVIKQYYFWPVVEKDFGQERFILNDPLELLNESINNNVDMIFGYTNNEATAIADSVGVWAKQFDYYPELLIPRKLLIKCKPSILLEMSDKIRNYYFGDKQISNKTVAEFVNFVSHTNFFYDVQVYAEKYAEISQKSVYFYRFSSFSERNVYGSQGLKYGIKGAGHLDDLMYLFNSELVNIPIRKNTRTYKLINDFCTLVTNFAKYGNPTPDNCSGVKWPKFTPKTKYYLDIDDKLTVGNSLDKDVVLFWQSIYDLSDKC